MLPANVMELSQREEEVGMAKVGKTRPAIRDGSRPPYLTDKVDHVQNSCSKKSKGASCKVGKLSTSHREASGLSKP
jgi:hypothetical protein